MDFAEYTPNEIKQVASALSAKYGSFEIRNGTELFFPSKPELTKEDIEGEFLPIIKEIAIKEVNTKAERARALVLTEGDGQKIAYAYKYIEALDIKSKPEKEKLDPNNYIMLSAELQLHGQPKSLREMADFILEHVTMSKKAFAWIEITRYSAHNEIQKAMNKNYVYAVLRAVSFEFPKDL